MPKPNREPAVAVAVVSAGTRELLAAALRSLEADHHSGLAEVWVVDNASRDGSPELVQREFPWVRLVALDENVGYGRAVNVVAERTATEWIVASNSDVRVERGALARLVATGRHDPAVAAVTPRLIQRDGETQHAVFPLPTIPFTVAFHLGLATLDPRTADRLCLEGYWNPDRRRAVPWAIAAFLVLRRSAFDAVGGFDPEQWIYAEDLDLGWRLHDAGWVTIHEPAAVVHHEVSASTRAAFGDATTERWMTASYACIWKRRGGLRARVTAVVGTAGAATRWAYFALRVALGSRRDLASRQYYRYWAALHSRGLRPPGAPVTAGRDGPAATGRDPSSLAAGSG